MKRHWQRPLMRTRRLALPPLLALLGLLAGQGSAQALSVDDARHLLTRTGFGAAPHEIQALQPLSRQQAVERLLDSLDKQPVLAPPPAFLQHVSPAEYRDQLGDYVPAAMGGTNREMSPSEERALTHRGMQEMEQLRVWWLDRMISTPTPFAERLALFWHGHFTSKYFDVLAPRLMYEQLQTIERMGKHNVGQLLHAMMGDPAMLIFLDNAINTRQAPNENLARELLELFTLGEGHYRETDIKQLARALAGHSVDFEGNFGYRFRPEYADRGEKTFLGQRGRLTREDCLRILLKHPRTALFITDKLMREFVSPNPDPAELQRLAQVLRRHDFAMRPLLRAMLLSPGFWAAENRGQLVKSPVELLVGMVRSVGLVQPDLGLLAEEVRLMGQDLFEPPTVKGWRTGVSWLTSETVRQRAERLSALWGCREAGWLAQRAQADDLLLRFSFEQDGAASGRLRVEVDGQVVAEVQPRCASPVIGAGQETFKPMWETLLIPRAQLPATVRSLTVRFVRPQGQRQNAFVNWVQLDGQRWPAYLSQSGFESGEGCNPATVPVGMLYCPGHLVFDLQALHSGLEPTLADRTHGPLNAVLESGTARQKLTMRPADLPHAGRPQAPWQGWQNLPLAQGLLPVPPLLATAPSPDLTERMAAMLRDPAFNLK
nr:DUF1800 family protein [uncultured Rhodoferax sp.]